MPKPRDRRRSLPSLESMERLQLLSATLVDGVWTIRGDQASDTIVIDRAPGRPGVLRAVEDGRVIARRNASEVREIRVYGLGGDDTLRIDERRGTIGHRAMLVGGRGDDRLVGGSGQTTLDGGEGTNWLKSGVGRTRMVRGTPLDSARRFGSSGALRRFLSKAVGQMRTFDGRLMALPPSGSPVAFEGMSRNAPDHSKTNVQVQGVDEADIVENDGNYLYLLSRGELVIVDARDVGQPIIASRTTIEGSPLAEFLDGDRLTVISSVWSPDPVPAPREGAALAMLRIRGSSQVKVSTFDVSNRAKPQLESETKLDGWYADSRMIDGKLYMVVQNNLLAGFWWGGGPIALRGDARVAAPATAVDPLRALSNTPVERLLPTFTTKDHDPDGTTSTRSGLITKAQDVFLPYSGDEANMMSLVVLNTRGPNPGVVGTSSIMGPYASTLYVNQDNLYVFSPVWDESGPTTNIFQFALASDQPTLVATGSVPGQLLDQFSADEFDGHLRVATTTWRESGTDNGIFVLQKQGERLNVVGSVTSIAPGEQITSARFMEDEAFLVTFEQVDPLFAIDMSRPTAPRIVGELKVPGFSRHLQPLGNGFLLGFGRDADPETGRTRGLKMSLFDVRDLGRPIEVATTQVATNGTEWNWSAAEWDHHALGYFPELGIVAVPVQGSGPIVIPEVGKESEVEWRFESDLLVFRVDTATGFQSLGSVEHTSSVNRSVRIGDVLFSIADLDVKSVKVARDKLDPIATLTIQTSDTSGWLGGPRAS